MPFNVAEFNAELNSSGFARPSHFEAWILAGPLSSGTNSFSNILSQYGLSDGMRFRIESVNLPGRNLITLDQNYYGPTRALPYRAAQQPVSLSVILSSDMREREVFMKWQDFMVGHYRSTYDGNRYRGMFDSRYYDDGIGTIAIVQYGLPVNGNLLEFAAASFGLGDFVNYLSENAIAHNTIYLEEAYPISVNDIQMSWADDGYARMNVEIRYRYSTETNQTFGDNIQSKLSSINSLL